MFVEAERSVALPFDVAKEALERALADGGLVAESRRAVAEGLVFVIAVGPRGRQGPAMDVLVRFLSGRRIGDSFVVPLRWEVTGSARGMFPALDANLELVATHPAASRLSIVGSYQPPLGRLGATIDRAAMSRVASATMIALLREIADELWRWGQRPTRP